MDSIPVDNVLVITQLDLEKRFPIYHAGPNRLAALLCGSAFPVNGLALHQDLDEVERHKFTGNVGMSVAYGFSILKIF